MCSYCGCEESEIIDRSRAEHAEIVNATVELRLAVHDGDQASVAQAARRWPEPVPGTHD